jgi:A/G-specific adenine glycosylase
MDVDVDAFRAALLAWHDAHRGARAMPWRTPNPDPYRVWLSEVMLQQTTVAAARPYFEAFVRRWPTVHALAAADRAEVMAAWAGLGYYSRARCLHACAQVVAGAGGAFPSDEAALRALPGVGPYTAAAVRAIAFGLPAVVVDANVERVVARYFAIAEPLPGAKGAIRRAAEVLAQGRADRPGDFAAAMMDLGAMVCTARRPLCAVCPVARGCDGRARGVAADLPRRAARGIKPMRIGFVYWVSDGAGRILVHDRPPRGLLGGMVGLPTSNWCEAPAHPAFLAPLEPLDITIRHVFTHFALELTPHRACATGPVPEGHRWVDAAALSPRALPTVFRKALDAFGAGRATLPAP